MNMTCTYIHNFQFTTIIITCVFIFISLLLIIPSEYSYSLSSFLCMYKGGQSCTQSLHGS